MIAVGPHPVRRSRMVACLSVAIASLLSASGMVMAERLAGRDLSELLADVIRPDSGPAVLVAHDQVAAGKDSGMASRSSPTLSTQADSPAGLAGGQPVAAGPGSGSQPAGASPARSATRGGGSPDPAGDASSPTGGSQSTGSGSGNGTITGPGGQGGAIPGPGGDLGGTRPVADGRHPLEHEVDALKPFVEREAGHTFKGPVSVRVLSGPEFDSRLAELNWLPKGDAAEQLEGVYRALGLIGEDVDLATELAKLSRPEFVTRYDAVAGQLLIRDRDADPYLRTMLVRELTRALDDQHFDIYRPGTASFNDESLDGLKALAEGDATRVYLKYRASLTAADLTRADSERERITKQMPDMNRAIRARFTYYVTQGLELVEAILGAGGRGRLDGAFSAPPTSSEQILHPDRYLSGDAPRPVAEPTADGPVVSHGVLGQIGLYAMLGEATDENTASRASQGWGGDRYVSWQDGNRTCVRQTILTDTAQHAAELGVALQQWAQARPGAEVAGSGPFTIKRCG